MSALMGHSFTIESDEAYALAAELSALTGKSMDVVVTEAVRERLAAERARQAKVGRIMALAAEFRTHLTAPLPSTAMHEFYDDATGLPI